MLDKTVFQNIIQQTLKNWSKGELLVDQRLVDLRYCQHRLSPTDHTNAQAAKAIRQLLEAALKTLSQRNQSAADLLRQRFLHNTGARTLAQHLTVSESQFYNLQNEALSQLTDIVLVYEQQAQFKHRLAIEARLEALGHQQLFGVAEIVEKLRALVVDPKAVWIISIEGLGGIGKTALADRIVRDLAQSSRFYNITWTSAKQQSFLPAIGITPHPSNERPALTIEALTDNLLAQLNDQRLLTLSYQEKKEMLQQIVKQQPYLIVIDNLETISDHQALIPGLQQLVSPSKVLLTSRHSLQAYAGIYSLGVTELSQADALALLHHETKVRGLTALSTATDEVLINIYNVVGGNPLALKLVLGQTHVLSLSQILENLKKARGRKITELYSYIYWQSWQALSDVARQALLALPVAAPRGSSFAQLAAVSQLEHDELSEALDQLTTLSLVETNRSLEDRRYSIHRLTETFLLTEVAQWPSSP